MSSERVEASEGGGQTIVINGQQFVIVSPSSLPANTSYHASNTDTNTVFDQVQVRQQPSVSALASGLTPAEEAARRSKVRLDKNKEAARECRIKKKEYIKCLENRVAVLENQNKALVEELRTLKQLYTGQNT